jgi:transcriptional regulator with XRE-family HTH domain
VAAGYLSTVEDMARGVMLPRLRDVRARRLLTQQELARRSGVAVSTLSRLEQGHTPAGFPTVRRLAEALGVEPAALMAPAPVD